MGRIQAARQDYNGAKISFRKAIEIAPQHEALAGLEEICRLTGERAEADRLLGLIESIHKLQKSLGVRGESQLARFYLDHNMHLADSLEMVREEYRTRKNVVVTDTLAWALYKNGQNKEAQQIAELAVKSGMPDAAILYHAGLIAIANGDRSWGRQLLYRALSLNQNFSPTFAPLAAAELKSLGTEKRS